MKQSLLIIILILGITFFLSACRRNTETKDNITELVASTKKESLTETSVITTETEKPTTTTETVSETALETLSEAVTYNENIQSLAHTYAGAIMGKLEGSDELDDFVPIGTDPEAVIGMRGSCSHLSLLDTDFDGIPELFTGVVGNIGGGIYEIFNDDGTLLGTALCCSDLTYGCIVNDTMYIFSGRNPYPGWVKIVSGCPSLYCTDFLDYDNSDNCVDITMADGTKKTMTDLNDDEVKALYPEYLGVSYGELEVPEKPVYLCINSYLRVPDPESYTEEDIYNCLLPLLQKYEEEAAKQ